MLLKAYIKNSTCNYCNYDYFLLEKGQSCILLVLFFLYFNFFLSSPILNPPQSLSPLSFGLKASVSLARTPGMSCTVKTTPRAQPLAELL